MSTRRALSILVLVLVMVASMAGPALAARPGGVTVYTDNGLLFGKSYGEWSAAWWQWIAKFGASPNPFTAAGNVDCRLGQQGSVWFLAGNPGPDAVVRSCTIPAGKALLIPVLNMAWSAAEQGDPDATYADLMGFIEANYMPGYGPMAAEVDGQPASISEVSWPRPSGRLPTANWAAGNPFAVPAGLTTFVAKGYYIFRQAVAGRAHGPYIRQLVWRRLYTGSDLQPDDQVGVAPGAARGATSVRAGDSPVRTSLFAGSTGRCYAIARIARPPPAKQLLLLPKLFNESMIPSDPHCTKHHEPVNQRTEA